MNSKTRKKIKKLESNKYYKYLNANVWKITTLFFGLFLLAIISINIGGINLSGKLLMQAETKPLDISTISDRALNIINTQLLPSGTIANLVNISEWDYELYKITIEIQGLNFDSYITKDGKILFPQSVELVQNQT